MPLLVARKRAIKTKMDFVLGSLAVVVLLPLLVAIAFVIKLDSRGSAFLRQRRVGQFGNEFDMYKFRSLHAVHTDAQARTLVVPGDQRVTRVGQVLRRYSLDELPQLFNVLKGEMSLVGPRPHALHANVKGKPYAEVTENYFLRYRVKPGMTGLAQINGWRGLTDSDEKLKRRVQCDLDYIQNWSLRLDLAILLRTIPSVLFPPPDNV
jgi:lipopolysaccharide/colanic/teichoic acid biosynthesis glycosyltransferase